MSSSVRLSSLVACTRTFRTQLFLVIASLQVTGLLTLALYGICSDGQLHKSDCLAGMWVSLCLCGFMLHGVIQENYIQIRCCILSSLLISVFLTYYYLNDTTKHEREHEHGNSARYVLVAFGCSYGCTLIYCVRTVQSVHHCLFRVSIYNMTKEYMYMYIHSCVFLGLI